MVQSSNVKGKGHTIEGAAEAPLIKRSKARAETRHCPVCEEKVPLRLLGKHAEVESERLEYIMQQIGSEVPIRDEYQENPGPNARSRLSAMKARKFIAPRSSKANSLEHSVKTLQTIKRHRKSRHMKLKEMIKEEDDFAPGRNGWTRGLVGGQIICPICATTVRGDQGVLEAHVDTCVATEGKRVEERRQQELAQGRNDAEDWETFNETNYVGNIRGAGFQTRYGQNQDVDEEIDIDGDDIAAFGAPQFTEGDLLDLDGEVEKAEVDVDVQTNDTQAAASSPHENPARLQITRTASRDHPNRAPPIATLNQAVTPVSQESLPLSSTTAVCRICLDPYEEPTVSTGCWHTCCRGCWLRCLGSTKLCPICKRITVPGDLRRIYL